MYNLLMDNYLKSPTGEGGQQSLSEDREEVYDHFRRTGKGLTVAFGGQGRG